MGKNSLIKSTSKKKNAAKKKKDDDTKKTAVKKKAVKKTAAKKSKATKKTPKKKPSPPPKKVSTKDLLLKKFDIAVPKKLFTADNKTTQQFNSPPFISGHSEEETKRIRTLLFKTFDMAEIKAAAEKAVAEKAAAEKAAAEKAAAEKAAAEKAAAEKAAAEKAAAEKAAAEKAAAEKAAAEKAAAEKAAPEKTADDKKTNKNIPVSVTYDTPKFKRKKMDSVQKSLVAFVAGIAFLFLLIIGASISNTGNFYLKQKDGALDVYQGRFSPMGEKLLISLPGTEMSLEEKTSYTKKDVYPLIFKHYIDKADTLLKVSGLPDFEGIKGYLNQALPYAITNELRSTAKLRLNNIDRMTLMYKAEVAINRDTIESLKEGLDHLANAGRLTNEAAQKSLIGIKTDAVKERLRQLEKEAEADKAAEAAAKAQEASSETPETQNKAEPTAETGAKH